MEGRSGLTLLLHTPVLSLTLVYIIFLVCSSCAAGRGLRDNRTRTYSRTHTGHGRHRCDFFIIRKELGKGGRGSGIIRVPGYFLFFSGPETGGDSGDNFLVPDLGPFLVPDPGLFLFCTSHFSVLTVLRIRDVYLTIFWLRILTRERVKEVTQGRYEGWVGGGGVGGGHVG